MERPAGQDILLMGVFDGHGAEGAPVSNCIAQKLPRILEKSALMKVCTSSMRRTLPSAGQRHCHDPRCRPLHDNGMLNKRRGIRGQHNKSARSDMYASLLVQPATVDSALSSAFPEANRAMRRNPSIDCDLSGSTGVVTMLVAATGKLVVANLGDSRAVIGNPNAPLSIV